MKRHLLPLIFALSLLILVPASWAGAPAPPAAKITGYVRDAESGTGIADTPVKIGEHTIVAGADGALPATALQIEGLSQVVDVEASATGFASWRYEGVTLRAGGAVELRVMLRRGEEPQVFEQPRPAPRAEAPAQAQQPFDAIPEFINIGRTGSAECIYPPDPNMPVERVRFSDYVRNVLPNEWIADWSADGQASLEAGAVAVKQYAWYNAFISPKWSGRYRWDLLDSTCDQVYVPNSATPSTDAAVARTWPVTLTRDGALFSLHYLATPQDCATFKLQWRIEDCMSQYASYEDASQHGLPFDQILQKHYQAAEIEILTLDPRAYLPLVGR